MKNTVLVDRRSLLKMLSSLPFLDLSGKGEAETAGPSLIHTYFESLARADGGYAWADDPASTLTTSFSAVLCYRLLEQELPNKTQLGQFIRGAYPMAPARRTDRPLHRFDYEQMQSLVWLGESIEDFHASAEQWDKPSYFTKTYEMHENPVLQQETGAILSRKLLGLPFTDAWRSYILSRRRSNGSFNNTQGDDGSDGHISNTLWGLLAHEALGMPVEREAETTEWLRSCQLENGGFTYAPHATLAATDHVVYTWAGLKALKVFDAHPKDPERAQRYLLSLWNKDGGFGDRPGRASNPLATMQALEALTLIGALAGSRPKGRSARRSHDAIPGGLKVYSLQVEAPGVGSPREAAEMARSLKIDLWGAKNSQPGWIGRAQQIADQEKIPVTFFVSDEEYGTYVSIPGLGTYSHLVDITAPAGSNFGAPMADKDKQPAPWPQFLSRRIVPLRKAGGNNVWQFNENEELTRILLDQAVEEGTFSAISSFHFGSEMFLNTQPFLRRYRDVMPYVGLQDAHTQTWWWMEYLVAFRTLFLAEQPTWEGWLRALKENWVVNVRHDSKIGFETQVVGSSNAVRKHVMDRQSEWGWWTDNTDQIIRPQASLVAITPEEVFEEGRPEEGVNLRVRCWWDTEPFGIPKNQVVKLLSLEVDGRTVTTEPIHIAPQGANRGDIYDLWHVSASQKGSHKAIATVKNLKTGEVTKVDRSFII